mmetsp:Transcript_12441/g.29283  ORF Transcript_12441/g.29283 Transcript_12441/m.29283 type:complete len:132 (-) Transcript_12441:515-910(-)
MDDEAEGSNEETEYGEEEDGDGAASEAGAEEEEYEEAVEKLNAAEEQLLAAHIGAVERNAVMCVEEGKLLSGILDKSVVDYDIDAYADRLEAILMQRADLTSELQRRLADFRAKSRAEENVSRRMSVAGKL